MSTKTNETAVDANSLAGKNWDWLDNFNGLFTAGARPTRMSMEHIVDKMWKHKMLRLAENALDP